MNMKEMVKEGLQEQGFDLANFDNDYETSVDNYNFEYDCNDAEEHLDFYAYCIDNLAWVFGDSRVYGNAKVFGNNIKK